MGEDVMKLYKIYREDDCGYDEYDSAVVVANNEDEARSIHPNGYGETVTESPPDFSCWVILSKVLVIYIGEASSDYDKPIVICASFNAG